MEGQQWRKGIVRNRKDERSYIVEGDRGGVYQRNRVHVPTTSVRSVPGVDSQQNETRDMQQNPDVSERDEESLDVTPSPPISEGRLNTPVTPAARPQRPRQKPKWMGDYDTSLASTVCNVFKCSSRVFPDTRMSSMRT